MDSTCKGVVPHLGHIHRHLYPLFVEKKKKKHLCRLQKPSLEFDTLVVIVVVFWMEERGWDGNKDSKAAI